MTETPGAAEPLPTPERLLISPNSALQIRLYLGGEAVKYPPVKVEQVTIEGVKEQHGRNEIDTMKKLGVCATYEGHQEWSQGEKGKLSHNAKVSSWASEVEGVFKKEGTKPHLEILKEIKTLGGIDLSSINQETAHKLYERYVKGEFNIKRFVDDLIAAHTENGVVNYSRLQSHLPSLTFLAGMFGKNTSLLLHDYLTAHIKFTKDTSSQQAFLKEVNTNNRINTLTPQEDQRLKWFFETSTQTKVVTVEAAKPIIPTKKEPTKTIEPIVIEPKEEPEKDFKIEEKPKVFVIEPPEIPDYSKLQKDERLNNLPGDTLRSAQFFCDNLRKRIQENGIVQQMKGPNNEDLLDITDPVTKKMNMTVGKREYVENGWFHSQGFIDWATENGLPLAYLVPGGNHAQILLKLENRGGKNGCVFMIRSQTRENNGEN